MFRSYKILHAFWSRGSTLECMSILYIYVGILCLLKYVLYTIQRVSDLLSILLENDSDNRIKKKDKTNKFFELV